jgi:hypothetical protein
MASHPTYDPSLLDEQGDMLSNSEDAPLLNRVTLGRYPPESVLELFSQALPSKNAPAGNNDRDHLYELLGFYSEPQLRMQVAPAGTTPENLRISPLQMALGGAALSNNGVRPAPRIALAANTPQQGWVVLPPLDEPIETLPESDVHETAQALAGEHPYWSFASVADNTQITWYLAGTLPDWSGSPLALVVLLEKDNPARASQIGGELIQMALQP